MTAQSTVGSTAPMSYGVFTMVGPGDAEARRLGTLIGGLFRHEPAVPRLVVVDDSGGDAVDAVREFVPATCTLVRLPNPARPSIQNLSANTLIALRHLAGIDGLRWALKLDTDALVIGPFAERLSAFFDGHCDVGQAGRAGRRCDGSATDYGSHRRLARRYLSRVQVWRSPRLGAGQAFWGVRARFRKTLRAAVANGLAVGEHCQGGGYAVSGEALRRLGASDCFDDADLPGLLNIAEDLMTSTLVAATGLKLASLTAPGEVFGVEARGLPMPPQRLAEQGYAVVHSIKNDATYTEAEIVEYFQRASAPASSPKA